METLDRVNALREFAQPKGAVPILVHPDPDPDALASAMGVRALLQRDHVHAPIITLSEMTRPENRRMAELLHLSVTSVTPEEIINLDRVIAVDFQPRFQARDQPRMAIIDHHPLEYDKPIEFLDVRSKYGATATIITEYLRSVDEQCLEDQLASALLYGIRTDTDTLARGSTAADVLAYAFLQDRADLTLLRKLERPAYSIETARLYGGALANLASAGDVALVYLGTIEDDDAHVLAEIADFGLSLSDITWALAAGIINNELVITIRHLGSTPGAGDLAKTMIANGGQGGGHVTMARAVLPLSAGVKGDAQELLQWVLGQCDVMRANRQSALQARPAKVHSKGPQ